MTSENGLSVCNVSIEYVPQLCGLLNDIILRGGTTSRREILDVGSFSDSFLNDEDLCSSLVALTAEGEPVGFQIIRHSDELPTDWGDISTFAAIDSPVRGVGTTLFAATLKAMANTKLTTINATIRSYNHGGLKYYSKMGFREYDRAPADPLDDGIPAEKIFHKRAI